MIRLCHISYITPHILESSLDVNLLDLMAKLVKKTGKVLMTSFQGQENYESEALSHA